MTNQPKFILTMTLSDSDGTWESHPMTSDAVPFWIQGIVAEGGTVVGCREA